MVLLSAKVPSLALTSTRTPAHQGIPEPLASRPAHRLAVPTHLPVCSLSLPSLGRPQAESTGGGAYTGSNAASSAPAKSTNVLPVKQYLSFKQINLQAVKTKATQFAEEIKTATVSRSVIRARVPTEDEADVVAARSRAD